MDYSHYTQLSNRDIECATANSGPCESWIETEENGKIEKSAHPDSKAKISYRLTAKGMDLLPIIMEIYIGSDKYSNVPDDIKATIKEAKKDKDKFVRLVTKKLKPK